MTGGDERRASVAERGHAARASSAAASRRQGLLFGDDVPAMPAEDVGFRGPTACSAAGITYRQLDYWARTGPRRAERPHGARLGHASASTASATSSCSRSSSGCSTPASRCSTSAPPCSTCATAAPSDLAQVTLMSDGVSVYECTSADEVVDLLQGGQGVFGIALGRVWREVEGSLAELPAVRAETASSPSARTSCPRRRAPAHWMIRIPGTRSPGQLCSQTVVCSPLGSYRASPGDDPPEPPRGSLAVVGCRPAGLLRACASAAGDLCG